MTKRVQGFTIVELLIVIVVVGILAATAIVAYSGVQERAKNTHRVSAATSYSKLLTNYLTLHGAYPAGTGSYCLGENYLTDLDANPDQDCGRYYTVYHPNSTWNDALRGMAGGTLPNFPNDKMSWSDTHWNSGIYVAHTTLITASDPIPNYTYIVYWLYGRNKDCSLRPILRNATGGQSAVDGASFSYSDPSSNLTECRIGLKAPANL